MDSLGEEQPNIDEVSGISLECMSMLVFAFFPSAERHYLSAGWKIPKSGPDETLFNLNINRKGNRGLFIHQCGSISERLELPLLFKNVATDRQQWLVPDFDLMFSFSTLCLLVRDNRPINSYMEMETISHAPGFCHVLVKSESPNVNSVTTGEYLDRLKLQKMFIKFLNSLNSDLYSIPTVVQSDKPDDSDRTSFSGLLHQSFRIKSDPTINMDVEFDSILSLPFKCPQEIENSFLERVQSKHFPRLENEILKEIFKTRGCHLVPKYHPDSDNRECEWRISFSVIERVLANTLSDMQRTCYRVLKAVVRSVINDKVPKEQKLVTYYLKTTLFWLCEETPHHIWTLKNLGSLWFKLVDKLIIFLQKGVLPNYFIVTCNLLDKDSLICRSMWIERLQEIRKDPFNAFLSFVNSYFQSEYYVNGCWFLFYSDWLHKTSSEKFHSFKVFYALQYYLMVECDYTALIRLLNAFVSFPFAITSNAFLILNQKQRLVFLLTLFQQHCQKPKMTFPIYFVNGYLASLLLAEMGNISLQLGLQGSRHYLTEAKTWFRKAMEINTKHVGTDVKYANYLRATCQYETGVKVLQQAFICHNDRYFFIRPKCHFSNILPDIVDICQQIELAGEDETNVTSCQLAYHLLCLCYIRAGVFAEVCLPNQWLLTHGGYKPLHKEASAGVNYDFLKYLGYQYLESKMYNLAAKCVIGMWNLGGPRKNAKHIFLFILARYATLYVVPYILSD